MRCPAGRARGLWFSALAPAQARLGWAERSEAHAVRRLPRVMVVPQATQMMGFATLSAILRITPTPIIVRQNRRSYPSRRSPNWPDTIRAALSKRRMG